MKFSAQIKQFNRKVRRNRNLIVAAAAQETFGLMSQRQPSIKETGSFEVGKTPVDEGILIGSLFFEVNGSVSSRGENSYVAGLLNYDLKDYIQFSFGSKYALRIENGFSGTDSLGRSFDQSGRFMVREALNAGGGWQGKIDRATRRIAGV